MSSNRVVAFEDHVRRHEYDNGIGKGDECKRLCWYADSELEESRLDARHAIRTMLHFKGKLDDIDPDKVTFRGVEKYGSLKLQKLKKDRVVVNSVLSRQSQLRLANQGKVCKDDLAAVSRHLSRPNTLFAHYLAAKHFRESESWNALQVKLDGNEESRKRIHLNSHCNRDSKRRCMAAPAS